MPKYTVEFTIDSDSLGHATNRALVALYKGDLDAEDVKVSQKGVPANSVTLATDDATIARAATRAGYVQAGGHIQGGYIETNPTNVQKLKDQIQRVRGNIPTEPHKDALN